MKKINILSQDYEIVRASSEEMKKILPVDGALLGLCDFDACKIYIDSSIKGSMYNRVMRHECTHAFLKESGLDSQCDFAMDEQLVDWVALQFPKMYKTFSKLGVVDDNSTNN